ncbi:hypothetical protein NL676_003860 [Syzygium grande]|nr:hypothetical protein NL676_003860 [Syzygium grande]
MAVNPTDPNERARAGSRAVRPVSVKPQLEPPPAPTAIEIIFEIGTAEAAIPTTSLRSCSSRELKLRSQIPPSPISTLAAPEGSHRSSDRRRDPPAGAHVPAVRSHGGDAEQGVDDGVPDRHRRPPLRRPRRRQHRPAARQPVVKNVASQSLEVKKLVYLYLLHYAEKRPNEALLSINCFQRDLGGH